MLFGVNMELGLEHRMSSTNSSKISVSSPKSDAGNSGVMAASCSDASDAMDGSVAGLSNSSKPHKGNDLRWGAVRRAKEKDGVMGLGHFRLLKKLGFGDIGSVYLAKLQGTGCFFAVKVMDREALAARKKLQRAQTEREILLLLDHPFLPTLYSHFETEKLSCLVMEFCSGGDLHTLRQRQPGRHFTEQVARLGL